MAGVAATALAFTSSFALSQGHTGGKSGGHESGTSHDSGHTSHEGGSKGKGGKGGSEAGRGKGGGHQSLRDVFRDMEDEARAETKGKKGKGASSGKGGDKSSNSSEKAGGKPANAAASATKGKKPSKDVAEDSDRPVWAGTKGSANKPGRPNLTPGIKKGTIYGDMYVIVRDANGVPILDAAGNVQVYYRTADGTLVCCIPRDPVTGDLSTAYIPIEVELGRLSVGRSPSRVLSAQLDEAIKSINSATAITLDAAGRIVLTTAAGTKTIDSPLENLALYVELINTGTIAGLDASKLAALGIVADGTVSATEFKIASSFFAAASDKTIPVTIDSIVYMNTILKIDGTLPADYVDYSSFVYDRQAVYENLTVTILKTTDGGTTWVATTVNVYDTVFASKDLDATKVAAFTAAADDARTVINYIHEYSVPVLPVGN